MTGAWEDPKIKEFIAWLKSQGFTNVRLFINTRKSMYLEVQRQSLMRDEFGYSEMYIVEAVWDGEYCCAYTDSLVQEDELLRQLRETAGVFQNREIPETLKESRDFRGKRWRKIDKSAVTESLMCAERKALACEKAHFVEVCDYQQYEETIILLDENMNYLADDDGNCTFTVRVVAKDGESVAAVTKYGIVEEKQEDFRKHICQVAERAAKHARFGLHGEKLSSGSYPIVLENCVMAELTGHYLPMFYGENMMHNTSALAGKEKEQVGCAALHIEEDPFSREGTRRRLIDDEGVPVTKTVLIQNGVFENVLYDKKSAADAGTVSTGNGFKPDVTADIGTGVTNVFLSSEGDTFSRKEMIKASEGGIYITKVEGMFAGADTESGDFSLLASGNRIVDGQVSTAVNQFTISGNICELWKDIEMIGNDPVYRLSDGMCAVSPSVKIKSLMVSGE